MQTSSVVLCSLLAATTALGQITPDNTLGNESSLVRPNVNVKGHLADLIEGGAIRESNLFHSFSDFNVAEFGRVYFANPAGITNILSRVTGAKVSNILGTLGVLGNANLFVINPNGIFLGPNSILDLGGSFFGSTADSVLFEDGTVFSAKNPNQKPLLTINIPSGLQYGSNPGSITNQSSLFQVPNVQTLGLIGGDINIPDGQLTATDGRIELGSVGSNSVVNLIPTDTSFVLDYSGVQEFQDISLSEGAFVNTSGESGGSIQVQGAKVSLRDRSLVLANTEGSGSGGGIVVKASQLSLEGGSRITTDVTGSGQGGDVRITTGELMVSDGARVSAITTDEGDSGNLTVDASESVQVIGTDASGGIFSGLSTQGNSNSKGKAGDLSIPTGKLIVSDGARVSTDTSGEGDGGNLTVNASSTVQIIGTSVDGLPVSDLSAETFGKGNGGDLSITTGELIVKDGARVSASTAGVGDGGDVSITTGQLIVKDGAEVLAVTVGEGDGGKLTVDASESVQLIGTDADGSVSSGLLAEAFGKGNGGDLSITTEQLMVKDGAVVSASTAGVGDGGDVKITTGELIVSDGAQVNAATVGEGDGGKLTVNADSTVQLIGRSADDRVPSGLFTQTNGTGKAGELKITTEQLMVKDGATVSASTTGEGDGGNLTVDASESVQLIGTSANGQYRSALATQTQGTGKAGELLKITTGQLIISDGAAVSAQSNQPGSSAGEVKINANSIFLNNNGIITAETAGDKGNINLLYSRVIRLFNQSQITTDADNTTGGNITIDTDVLLGLGNSDITANAEKGPGGRVEIDASKGIFGLKFRDRLTSDNDITATSDLGPSFSGEVILNTPGVDPTSGLTELPGILVDAEAILANDLCGFENNRIAGGSSFTITGKGGLPASADDPVINSDTTVGWRTRPGLASSRRQQLQQLRQQPKAKGHATRTVRPPSQDKKVIIEAQGWVTAKDGTIILTAHPFRGTPVEQILPHLDCHSGVGSRK
ncbi:S-layer family protein [Moorena sp. SIO4G3]|uniref:S-layer family protein n=1 Tax=Moorena sp. SIO4G3 TaxID=2607821 RepID=UPI001429451A|nr:S-layer family protein [Moorena sp. SIO4G3]NEO80240.1 S-layer family protein [Moorena sp. SIO4G3]